MIKLSVLSENTVLEQAPELLGEHGLSLYLETATQKILFDTGASDNFIHNADRMGIDLRQVDAVVISHGHYDHCGGLKSFLNLNDKASVYINRQAFLPHFYGSDQYIGMDPQIIADKRFVLIDDFLKLDSSMSLYSCNGMCGMTPANNKGMNMLYHGRMVPDQFWHEQYLLIQDDERKILISGCSHKGILNIVQWFMPDILVGGFHFMELDPEDPKSMHILDYSAKTLAKYPIQFYTGHCTGKKQYPILKDILGEQLHALHTGMTITL